MPQKPHVVSWIFAMTALIALSVDAQADPVGNASLPPWGLFATSTEAGVELSWNAPPTPVDVYIVYRADDRDAVIAEGLEAFHAIGQTSDLTFLDTGSSTEGEEPRGIYYVTALVSNQESPPSNPADTQYPHCWNINEPEDCFIP